MLRINHIALKVPDLMQASALYEGVFDVNSACKSAQTIDCYECPKVGSLIAKALFA